MLQVPSNSFAVQKNVSCHSELCLVKDNTPEKETPRQRDSVVSVAGDQMKGASQEFAEEPCSSMKRGAMVRAARALLSSVTRLLILADMVDVHLLLKKLRVVSAKATLIISKRTIFKTWPLFSRPLASCHAASWATTTAAGEAI